MSKELLENILNKDFVLAESYIDDRLNSIMEKKLYEKKRMIAAKMDEAFGGLTKAEIQARKEAGYRKAADVLGDPRKDKLKPLVKIKKLKDTKIKENVDVQPDPEGRVAGGKPKSAKGTFKRKALAATAKALRKTGSTLGGVVGDIGIAAGRAKSAFDQYSSQRAQQTPKRKAAPETKKSEKSKDFTGQGNTPSAMYGRLKQHVTKKVTDHKPAAPGSGVLKAAKWTAKTIASDLLGSVPE